jgi:UDP-3-O-[3-hydroxymyristoyl] glucosamine N-acyltransferase
MKLRELADMLGADVHVGPEVEGGPKVEGGPEVEIHSAAGINDAGEGSVTLFSDVRLHGALMACRASAVIAKEPVAGLDMPQLLVENPQLAFARTLKYLYVKTPEPLGVMAGSFVSDKALLEEAVTVYPTAFVAAGAKIGARTVIYPHVYVGPDAVIGRDCVIYPNVTIRESVVVGSRVILQPGAVIGSDGFGYVFDGRGHFKIPQVGTVVIEDDVEIGANSTIDRATTGRTVIGAGTKIDNLVQVGHNTTVGRNSILVAQVGISGSCTIGDFVQMGGQAGVADHVVIESGAKIGAQAGVIGELKKDTYLGTPAIPHRRFWRVMAAFMKLPELSKKVAEIEKKLAEPGK